MLRPWVGQTEPYDYSFLVDDPHVVSKGATELQGHSGSDAEFRKLIELATSQIIDPGRSEVDVSTASEKNVSKLSQQAEVRESTGPAISQIEKLSEDAKLRHAIRPFIPQIIALLSHNQRDVREAGVGTLSELSEKAACPWAIQSVRPYSIIPLLSHDEWDVREAGVDALLELSKHDVYQGEIKRFIPQIIIFLDEKLDEVSKPFEHTESGEAIWSTISRILALLGHSRQEFREAGADALSNLSKQTESIKPAIPQIIALLNHSNQGVCKAVVDALLGLSKHTEFRESIRPSIPQIIGHLSHSNQNFYQLETSVNALLKLSEYAEFRDLIQPSIPQIIGLLTHRTQDVCIMGLNGLSKLSDHSEFRESIQPAIPQIIALLSHSEPSVCRAGVNLLSKLSEHTEFQEAIQPAIPQIIALLSHSEPSVCRAGVNLLLKLSGHTEFQGAIQPAIPPIITLLGHEMWYVRQASVDALWKLSEHTEFRETIKLSIPRIIAFLSPSEQGVCGEGLNVLVILSEDTEFREAIQPAIPLIIALLSHSKHSVCKAGVNAVLKLSENTEFREAIQPAIPSIIALLSDSEQDVRAAGVNALLKLSEHIEFREEIRPAIPHIVSFLRRNSQWDADRIVVDALLKLSEHPEFREAVRPAIPLIIDLFSRNMWYVDKVVVDALLKFSEHPEFQEAIKLAIPHIIAVLGNSMWFVCEAGVNALLKLSQHTEFRESIQPAIPHIIAFLSNTKWNVRKAGVDALSKLSEQAELRESIKPAIPQINALLNDLDLDVRQACVHALQKFSNEAEFRGSNVVAIPQRTTLFDDINQDVWLAGPAALAQLPEKDAGTVPGIVDNDKSEYLQTTTCWIAAEHALKHARSNMSSVSDIFDRSKIQKSEYAVYAGFDESLIKSGVGYIEQIHVFVSAKVDANSPLLAELGRLFSPFSSILFTGSSWYRMPVSKAGVDGDVWNFDELTYFTASKFADGGSSAKTPLTVISLSQTPRLPDGPTGFSRGGSSTGDGEKNRERRPKKGKERDRGDSDGGDKGEKNDEDPHDDPEEPFEDPGGTIAGPAKIFFEIVSKVYPIHDNLHDFQTLKMEGGLTIKTTPPVPQSPDPFSTRHVQLTGLTFGTEPTMVMAYEQFYVRVTIRSQHKHARVKCKSPKRTPESEKEEKQATSTKKAVTRGMEGCLTLGPRPQGTIKVAKMKTDEETEGFEKKRYTSRITEQHLDGRIWWGFYVDDLNEQESGIELPDDALPTVCFEFVGDPKVPPPPPERMDLEITSYWSIIPKSEEESDWIRTFLNLSMSSGNSQATSYSNLCQMVALKTVPSDLPPRSDYKATMHVRPGVPHTDYFSCYTKIDIPTADSVTVTEEFTADDWRELSTSKLKLSDYCTNTLENSGGDTKSH